MYNVEKYIGECLESILSQEFQNYEVILVNDCSTDNSRQIAESYLEKFGWRLRIYDNKNNSGVSATRNKGLMLSGGEYIFFMDSDDLITADALEVMFEFAKDYDADVVYFEKYFKSDEACKNLELKNTQGSRHIDKPTLEPENLAERVEYISRRNFWGVPWNKFIRREFLIENEIFFPPLTPCEDHIWTFGLFFFAKRFLRVPNATYIWRMSKNSAIRSSRTPLQRANFWLNASLSGTRFLDQMLDKLEFFQQNPQYRYAMLEKLSTHMFELSFRHTLQAPQHIFYDGIKNEFGKKFGEQAVLISVLVSLVNKYQKAAADNKEQITKLEEQLKANKEKN